MSEENAAPVTGQPAPTTPTNPFTADGTLVENWHTMAPEGYEELVKINNEEALKITKEAEQQREFEFQALKDKLVNKWGNAYNQNVHLGEIAVDKAAKGDDEFKQRILDKVNADPDLIEMTANLGSLFAEHKIVETTKIPTPGDLQDQINEIMAKPEYTKGDQQTRMRLANRVMALREKMNQGKTITI